MYLPERGAFRLPLLLELRQRLELVGLATEDGFGCPLNQYLLADALGLTAIHLNRVLRQLREQHLLTFRGGRVEFHDLARLQELTGFQGDYLDQGNGNESRVQNYILGSA